MPEPVECDRDVADVSPTNKKRRRASKACIGCRKRKIRCDVLQTGCPCTKCRADGFECDVKERRVRRQKVDPGDRKCFGDSFGIVQSEETPGLPPISQHSFHHLIPHYPFFQTFRPLSQYRWLKGQGQGQDVALPLSSCDHPTDQQSASVKSADEMRFLQQKGAFEIPPKKNMDQFVSSYFLVFHPFFPIIDKCSFLTSYHKCGDEGVLSGKGPSLLLLQAINFIACSVVPWETLQELNFASRKEARSVFHRRVRYLYDFDYETDDIITIQSLLLMSQHYSSMVEQKHTSFWLHQAICLAQGVGLHHDPGQLPQRKLWARLWWSCVIRDRLIAMGSARPMQINSLDCTVPMLTLADLDEESDSKDDRTIKAIFVDFVKLCQYMEGVLSLPNNIPTGASSLCEQIELCETTLHHWLSNLSPAARRQENPATTGEESSLCALYRAILRMIYNIVIIRLNQSYYVLGTNRTAGLHGPLPKLQSAAQNSTCLAMELIDLDIVKFCPTICVTAILPPLMVHLLVLRTNDELNEPPSTHHFDTCLDFLKQLGEIFWHASFYHQLFASALSNSQPTTALIKVVRDPLVASLSDKSPGRIITKSAGGRSQLDPDVVAGQPNYGEMGRHRRGNAVESAPIFESLNAAHETPALESADANILSDTDKLFADLLKDLGYFHNGFPSA